MLQFEGYTLDVSRHSLRAANREVALRRKSFELLRYLVENPDRLVTKEELLKAIWPNAVVTDESLTQCLREVRRAIGDSKQTIIATVPRCGYRFAAPVVCVAANAAPAPPSSADSSPRAPGSITNGEVGPSPSPLAGEGRGGGARASGTGAPYSSTPDPSPQGGKEQGRGGTPLAGFDSGPQPRPNPPTHAGEGREEARPSVAVLPFTNLGGDPQQDYFSDGMTEDITTELSRFSELVVIARNSAFQYKGKAVDIRQVGRELGARYVLEGSVRRSGDRIRIAAQLIDAMTGAHRWADRYDHELHDAFAVQDEIARTIVRTLAAHVNRAEIERALLKPPAAWEAYEYYLRGSEAYFLHLTRRTKASLHDARRLLEQSLAIDPDYARAAALLARTHHYTYFEPLDGDYLSPAALDRALELAEAAVRLDPRLPPARAQLGFVLLYKHRHDAGTAEFERGFALNPNFIDFRFGNALMFVGEPARAIEVLEAGMRLDPFAPTCLSSGFMGPANYTLKRYEEAVRWLRECTLCMPNVQWPHAWLAAGYARLGQLEEAGAEAAEVLRINSAFTIESWKRTTPFKDPKDLEHLTDGLRKAGLPEG
jgi:adenylate cyclase